MTGIVISAATAAAHANQMAAPVAPYKPKIFNFDAPDSPPIAPRIQIKSPTIKIPAINWNIGQAIPARKLRRKTSTCS